MSLPNALRDAADQIEAYQKRRSGLLRMAYFIEQERLQTRARLKASIVQVTEADDDLPRLPAALLREADALIASEGGPDAVRQVAMQGMGTPAPNSADPRPLEAIEPLQDVEDALETDVAAAGAEADLLREEDAA